MKNRKLQGHRIGKYFFHLPIKYTIIWVLALFMPACAPIGKNSVTRDRFAYAEVYADTWKHQMLLNMVKLRYADTPVFLEISSIISQYLIETELSGNLSWNTFLPTDSQFITGRGRYADRPTITYQPLTGDKFTRSLMRPLPPSAVLSLVQSGWQVDLVLRICIDSINGIHNRERAKFAADNADPDFYRIMDILSNIQQARAIDLRVTETKDNAKTAVLVFRQTGIDNKTKKEILKLKQLLDLDPDTIKFNLVYGSLAENNKEIAILSRSMLEIFQEMGSYIEVPENDVNQKRVTANRSRDADLQAGVKPLMRIQSSKSKKIADTFVSVRYRGNTFWIDDRDYQSKKFFSFMMFLLTLAETGVPSQAPIVTIPVS